MAGAIKNPRLRGQPGIERCEYRVNLLFFLLCGEVLLQEVE